MYRIFASLIVLLMVISTSANAVQVDGFCYLEGEQSHEGTKVFFEAASPTAVTDSVFTDATGYFHIDLEGGIYTVEYTQDGF